MSVEKVNISDIRRLEPVQLYQTESQTKNRPANVQADKSKSTSEIQGPKNAEVQPKVAEVKAKADAEAEKRSEAAEKFSQNLDQSLQLINSFIPIANTNLVFEFDDVQDPPIIKVIDKETKELIREIPSQELEKVAKAFSEMVDKLHKSGALINLEA